VPEVDLLGPVEAAVLRAVGDGPARPHRIAMRLDVATEPSTLYAALDRCRRAGLLRSERDRRGRSFVITAAGRRRLRSRRDFAARLAMLVLGGAPEGERTRRSR
jgi:DNA-binding PadR family transcriptional regulator